MKRHISKHPTNDYRTLSEDLFDLNQGGAKSSATNTSSDPSIVTSMKGLDLGASQTTAGTENEDFDS